MHEYQKLSPISKPTDEFNNHFRKLGQTDVVGIDENSSLNICRPTLGLILYLANPYNFIYLAVIDLGLSTAVFTICCSCK